MAAETIIDVSKLQLAPTTNQIFESLKSEQLEEFFQYTGIPYDDEKSDKRLIKQLESTFVNYGIQKLVERLRRTELVAINEEHKLQKRKNEAVTNSDKSAPVLRKRIHEEIIDEGLHSFLSELDKKTLILFLDALELSGSGSEEHLRDVIENEVHAIGLRYYVTKCDSQFLRDCVKSSGQKAVVGATRKSLIDAFIYQVDAKEVMPQKEVEKISKDAPKIRKGVSGADLFQWYNRAELIDYARDHDITPLHGKKKEVIERILAYLENRSKSPIKEKKDAKEEPEKKEKKDKKKSDESK